MPRFLVLLKADLKLFYRNFFSVLLVTIAGSGLALLADSVVELMGLAPELYLSVCFWLILLFSTLLTVLPVVFRDYRLGLVAQYSLAGIKPLSYFLEKLFLITLQLCLPLFTYAGLFVYFTGASWRRLPLLLLVFFLETFALVELTLFLAGLTAEFSDLLFFVLLTPLLLPLLLAAVNLFQVPFLAAGELSGFWLHWLVSYVVMMAVVFWVAAEFMWEEF